MITTRLSQCQIWPLHSNIPVNPLVSQHLDSMQCNERQGVIIEQEHACVQV